MPTLEIVMGAPRKVKNLVDKVCGKDRAREGVFRYALLSVVLAIQLIGASTSSVKGGDIEVEVKMPKEAQVASSAELKCDWRLLGGNILYSVKWYKDDHEFFRYVPDNDPRIQTFPQPGIHLDKRFNSDKSIRLRDLELASSGQYKCEVSTEAPSFATTYQTANLTVIALPERGPEITGLSSHYALGENVTANCTAWPSVPRAKLRWTINGELVSKEKTIQYPELGNFDSTTSLGLRVETEPEHFQGVNGPVAIRIKCIAQVGSSEFQVEKQVPMAYVNNQRLSAGEIDGTGEEIRGNAIWLFSLLILVLLTT